MEFAEANKRVHPVETQWHHKVLTPLGFVADTKEGIGFVRQYWYTGPNGCRVKCCTGASADYWESDNGGKGYWGTLEAWAKQNCEAPAGTVDIVAKPSVFKHGDLVEWNEGSHVCYGKVISEIKDMMDKNQFGSYTINVGFDDKLNYHRACHTAYEMNSGWVDRSIDLSKLRLRTT